MNRIEIEGVGLEVAHIPGPNDRAPLIFLHEGLGSVAMWQQRGRHWPRELCEASGRTGWLYSRRGYGQSDPIPDVRGDPVDLGFWSSGRHLPDYMHREAWRVLPAVLAALGVTRPPVLVGHSDGATISLLHASQHPVAACIAMAPHVIVEDVSLRAISQARDLYLSGGDSPAGLRARLARYHADVDNAFWQWNDIWLDPAFAAYDIRGECGRIRAPLCLVQGLGDEYGTMAQLRAIEAAAPQACITGLPDCGHSPHTDQPDAATAALRTFLETVD
ncbi:alpha/beta hydrolase [Hydrogenophaga sp.]|uniref:alpha/beta fold hydrolase n=1 Tax=Hydrogenophaga sp. TaxID=1904254 RepID=UPI002610FE6C|nr:alpha/beta hydrolase [Hydrogenophaga sp.]MCW5653660.1 alpha/beta hydrolase [Hydrogenophaga sp.]